MHQQDIWTNWLEYLNFEKWHLRRLTSKATTLEPQFVKSWELLAGLKPQPPVWRPSEDNPRQIVPIWESEADQPKQLPPDKAIREFIRATKKYKNTLSAIRFQNLRVEWVIAQAHILRLRWRSRNALCRVREERQPRNKRQLRNEQGIKDGATMTGLVPSHFTPSVLLVQQKVDLLSEECV